MSVNVIGACKVLTCDTDFHVFKNGGVAFEGAHILAVGDYNNLCQTYAVNGDFFENSILVPALINPHVHIEFSAPLSYSFGSFGSWLSSLMSKREQNIASHEQMQTSVDTLYRSGVGTIGAISSYGMDQDILVQSSLRVLYFNELIGSDEQKADEVYQAFLKRLKLSQSYINEYFHVGIAIHSPYSVAPSLLKRAIEDANEEHLPLSVHFLESQEERQWLEKSSGFFKDFYASFNPDNSQSFYSIDSFLSAFNGFLDNILFVHCTQASQEEIRKMSTFKSAIVSCPRSNRLLSGTLLDYHQVQEFLPCLIATDSLASNFSLSLLDELRVALFAFDMPLNLLAKELLLSVTAKAAKMMNFQNGILTEGYLADMAIFELPDCCMQDALSLILYGKEAKALWVGGKKII